MKRTGKRARRRGRPPGRKERRKRAAKALAAAGAIAGGTQAYSLPVRFDNPPHGEPGHFHWVGPIGTYVWLDFALSPEDQLGYREPTAVAQRVKKICSNLRNDGDVQADTAYPYLAVCVPAETLIPTDGYAWQDSATYIFYPDYGPESKCPEGQPGYLGIRFDVGSGYQYAWIGVVRTGLELEAFAWGREREPGVPIRAGALSQGACFGPEGCVECTEAECEKDGGRYMGDGITCEAAVPTVSEWGLAIMALALLAAGTWVVKKRVPQPQPSEA